MGDRNPGMVEQVTIIVLGLEALVFTYLLFISRQVPGLPKSMAAAKKSKKKAIGIGARRSMVLGVRDENATCTRREHMVLEPHITSIVLISSFVAHILS